MSDKNVNNYPDSATLLALLQFSQAAAKVGGWQYDIVKNHLYWTDETYRIHDTTPEEFDPTVDAGINLFLPESARILGNAFDEAMLAGTGYALELETYTTKGRIIDVFTTCEVTMVNGKPSKMTGIFQDITEKNRVKNNLQKEQLLLQNILSSAVDGIILIDKAGKILSFSAAAERIFSRDLLSVKGENVSILFADSSDGLAGYIDPSPGKVVETGLEFTAKREDGDEFPLDLSITEWSDGEKSMFTLVVRDISAQKLIQAQLIQTQKLESVSQLSGGLAHDFNNLLAIIVGNLDILKNSIGNDAQNQIRIEAAMRAVARGEEITRRMLSFSRLQANQSGSVPPQDVNVLLHEMMEILQHTLGPTYEISFSTTDTSIWAQVDPAEFENVILNLAVNARDAMPDGGCIEIKSSNSEIREGQVLGVEAGHWLQLEFLDEGCGIEKEVMDRIFEPFFTTKTDKGSGLGLAMAYSLANQSKGHIRVESELGKGTQFTLYLPVFDGLETKPEEKVHSGFVGGSELILIVDDEKELLELVQMQLNELGYKTIIASDVNSALEIVKTTPGIDLLLSDVMMPGGTLGTQLALMAKKLQPNLKVLLTSGFSQSAIDGGTTNKYEDNILQKPYRLKELSTRVRAVIDG